MIPQKTIEELIDKHSSLEKDLSSGKIDKALFTEKSKDYDLKFQAKSLSNNVSMAISNEPINALTFCIWFQTTQSGSFGLVGGDLDLICDEYSQCNFSLKGAKR